MLSCSGGGTAEGGGGGGGGGGVGPVTRKLVRADHFSLPKLVRVAESGPGFINLNETSPCTVKFVYMGGVLLNMIRGNRCVQ